MKKEIKLLQLLDENNFIDIYFVVSRPTKDILSIESIAFLTSEEAEQHCNYLNRKYITNKYSVYKTSMYVY